MLGIGAYNSGERAAKKEMIEEALRLPKHLL